MCPHWLPRPVTSTTRSHPVGRDGGTRTHDLVLPKHAYYQLYYTPIINISMNKKNPTLSNGVFKSQIIIEILLTYSSHSASDWMLVRLGLYVNQVYHFLIFSDLLRGLSL